MTKPVPITDHSPSDPDYRAWFERWAPHDITRPFTPGMYEGKTLAEVESIVGTSPSLSKGDCRGWHV
jgi:hypothetical protein